MIRQNGNKYRATPFKKVKSSAGVSYTGRRYLQQTQLIFARALALGYTVPNDTIKAAMNSYIADLVNSGAWDAFDGYWHFMFNDVTLTNFSLINWKRPYSALATLNGSGVLNTYGYKGNTANFYINTNFNPATQGLKYTQNKAGRGTIVYNVDLSYGFNYAVLDGVADNTLYNNMWCYNSQFHRVNQNAIDMDASVNLAGIGITSANRDNATDLRYIKNTTVMTAKAASAPVYSANQVVLRRRVDYSGMGISNYWMGDSLTNAQVENMRTSFNTYTTAIGLIPFA